jgi:hypothetical protein
MIGMAATILGGEACRRRERFPHGLELRARYRDMVELQLGAF